MYELNCTSNSDFYHSINLQRRHCKQSLSDEMSITLRIWSTSYRARLVALNVTRLLLRQF